GEAARDRACQPLAFATLRAAGGIDRFRTPRNSWRTHSRSAARSLGWSVAGYRSGGDRESGCVFRRGRSFGSIGGSAGAVAWPRGGCDLASELASSFATGRTVDGGTLDRARGSHRGSGRIGLPRADPNASAGLWPHRR